MKIEISTHKKLLYSLGGVGQESKLMSQRRGDWIFYLHMLGGHNISFGFTLDWWAPNFEIHLPFLFLKFGREVIHVYDVVIKEDEI